MVHIKLFESLPMADIDTGDTVPSLASSWEDEVLRRIAPLLSEVRRRAAEDEALLGWEAAGVQRLAQSAGGEL